MDMRARFVATRNIEIAAARRSGTDEDSVIAFIQQTLHRFDTRSGAQLNAECEDVTRFFVDDFFGKAETRNLRADHSAGLRILIKEDDLVAERGKIPRHGQGGRTCSDAGNAPSVHATKDRAVVEGGQIVVRPMNYLALSYDHRIIDGREAVLSLVAMKDALEDPARLLLEL